MKKYFLISLCMLFLSCQMQRYSRLPGLTMYKTGPSATHWYPTYLIIKDHPRIFEIYEPSFSSSIVGEWRRENDTLYLTPQYEYYGVCDEIHMDELFPVDSTLLSIPRKHLIGKNTLTDKTNYSIIILPLGLDSTPGPEEVYTKIR